MYISREAMQKINEIEDLLCGTIMVHMFDQTVLRKKNNMNSKGVYFEDEDAPSVSKAKVVKVCSQLPEELKNLLNNKFVMANIYSGKDYWKNDHTGELLILMNVEGILSILKSKNNKKKKEYKNDER